MNFYYDDIVNDIIDHSEIEDIIPKLDLFKESVVALIQKYSYRDLHVDYTQGLLTEEDNKIAFFCIDHEFSIYNCPTMLIYQKYTHPDTDEIIYYIFLICTKPSFRNKGYASKILDGFIQRVNLENPNRTQKIKIILSSLESAVLFYESYGFRWTCDSLSDHEILMQHEIYEDGKEYFILELDM